jgi:NitT/TauT family transport system substrate-binding protein
VPIHRRDFITMSAVASLGGIVSVPGVAVADDPKLVRVLSVPSDGTKGILYAQKAGLFRKRGITIDVQGMSSGAAIYAAVLGGAADLGGGNLFSVFSAYARGVPLRIVAPVSLYTTEHADTLLLVRKDSPIQSARDLNGKTIASNSVRDVDDTATRVWVDNNGGDGKSLHVIELKAAEQVIALDTGRIDAVAIKPPFLTIAMGSGKYRVLGKPLDAIANRFLLSCYVATADYIAKNPAIVSSFAAALAESARYTNANQNATNDMVAAFSGQDPALLGRGVRSVTAETVTLADLQRPLDFAYKNGLLEKTFDVSGILAPGFPLAH